MAVRNRASVGILMQGVLPIPRLVNIDMALKRLELGASS